MAAKEPVDLVTESGKRVPELQLHSSHFLDKVAVIFGPTRTGKTVIVKHGMKLINEHVDQVLVVSPSELSNRSYDGVVDAPLIHYRLWLPDPTNSKKDDGTKGAIRFLEALCKRQEMMASIYSKANDLKTLARLYGRLPKADRVEGLKYVELVNKKRERVVGRVRDQYGSEKAKLDEKIKEVNEKFMSMLILLYKKYIVPHYEALLARPDLTEDERYSLHYLNFNPRILIIFDDCAAELKVLFSKENFKSIFYRGRHSFISCIICCQDDTDLPTNLRKNARLSIFTEPIVASSNFDRASNKFSKQIKQYVADIVQDVFQGHRKLAYIRDDTTQFYHVTATQFPTFKFGSNALQELCNTVKTTGMTIDASNPYYSAFAV